MFCMMPFYYAEMAQDALGPTERNPRGGRLQALKAKGSDRVAAIKTRMAERVKQAKDQRDDHAVMLPGAYHEAHRYFWMP